MLGHQAVEAEVRHLRDGDEVDAQVQREDGENLVAVNLVSPLVHGEHAIPVPVEGDAQVGPLLEDDS